MVNVRARGKVRERMSYEENENGRKKSTKTGATVTCPSYGSVVRDYLVSILVPSRPRGCFPIVFFVPCIFSLTNRQRKGFGVSDDVHTGAQPMPLFRVLNI